MHILQDELEREIERLKQKLGRRSSKSSTDVPASIQQRPNKSPPRNSTTAPAVVGDEICEICEKPGHDIFSCPLLKDNGATDANAIAAKSSASKQPFCSDCESYGHTPADCPHSLDVF